MTRCPLRGTTGSPRCQRRRGGPAAFTTTSACSVSLPQRTPLGTISSTARTLAHLGAQLTGAREQRERRCRRIDDAVRRHEQSAREAAPQLRLRLEERALVEHLGRDPVLGVESLLRAHGVELRVVFRHPDGAAPLELRRRAKISVLLRPERRRVPRERELLGRVVHDDEMAHSRGRRAERCRGGVEDEHAHAVARERSGARGADDAGADDDRVGIAGVIRVSEPAAEGIVRVEPQRRLARSRTRCRARAERVRHPGSAVSQPVNRPPTTLSWRQARLTRAARAGAAPPSPPTCRCRRASDRTRRRCTARSCGVGVAARDGGPASSMWSMSAPSVPVMPPRERVLNRLRETCEIARARRARWPRRRRA